MPKTIIEKIWEQHVVRTHPGEPDLLYIDLHLVHEVTSPQAFESLRLTNRKVRRPDLTLATVDHNVPTTDRSLPNPDPLSAQQLETMRQNAKDFSVPLWDIFDLRQGIVHIISPEQGLTQPGMTIVCGDSHTSTHGAFGALAFGIGTSDVDGGVGHVIEYRGEVIRSLSMEGRMTVCNMTIEGGARAGLVAPDEKTIEYLKGRPYAPTGEDWDAAVEAWNALVTDEGAKFDTYVELKGEEIAPHVTWGTTPAQSVPITSSVPKPEDAVSAAAKETAERSLVYMDLKAGTPIEEISIDRVFIGSCTNGRIEDLRAAAAVAKGRKVASTVRAMVVPGSGPVKMQAEAEGLHQIFLDAGFEWREPGCSMCLGMNPDILLPGERAASTSNRNFEGRQGVGGRTHLVSPEMAAAAAIEGHFVDIRRWK